MSPFHLAMLEAAGDLIEAAFSGDTAAIPEGVPYGVSVVDTDREVE